MPTCRGIRGNGFQLLFAATMHRTIFYTFVAVYAFWRVMPRVERYMFTKLMPANFNCKRCGICCKKIGIPWSELDPAHAADYLGISLSDFIAAYGFIRNEYSGEIEPTEYNAAPCPFLRYDKKNAVCRIYPVRPWICKSYPGLGTECMGGRKRTP